jgi:uncharacterized protein YbbC (DUF1343 family)
MNRILTLFGSLLVSLIICSCSFQTGLDVAAKDNFSIFNGKKVGIVTNHTALSVILYKWFIFTNNFF